MFSFDSYEEGVEAGIERGQHLLLMQLLTQRLGTLSEKYIDKLESLENNEVINIALDIFNIKTFIALILVCIGIFLVNKQKKVLN